MKIVLPEKAEEIVKFRGDPELQTRIEELAEKSNEGELNDSENAEYAGYVRANKYVAILKRQARAMRSRPRPMNRLEAIIDEMLDGSILLDEALEEFEKLYIQKAFTRNKKRISETAAALGIHRNTISKRVNSYRAAALKTSGTKKKQR